MKIKGFTLVEAMVAIGISAFFVSGTFKYFSDKSNDAQINAFSSKVVKIVSGIDQRVYIDKYDKSLWPAVTDYVTTNQFQEFLSKELISRTATCGNSAEGWEPQIIDPSDADEVSYKESLKLVPCKVWQGDRLEFGLDAKHYLSFGTDNLESVTTYYYFAEDKDFEDNFLNLKQSMKKIKELDTTNVTGSHLYTFVDMSKSNPSLYSVTALECLALKKDCGLMARYNADGVGVEHLDVTGGNSMINSKIDFVESIDSDVINTCFAFNYNSSTNVWSKVSNVDCGIGIDPSKNTSYVEADVHSVNAQRVHLNKLCLINVAGVSYDIPCGMYTDNITGTESALAVIDEIHATNGHVYLLDVKEIQTKTLSVDGTLTVNGTTELNELTVNDESTFNDTVTMNGLNNTVEEDLTVYGKTDLDMLNVSSNAIFNKNVQIQGYLDVRNGYIAADHIKLDSITKSELNSSCSIEGAMKIYRNGEHSEIVICTDYRDIDGTRKVAWKLANARIGQIMPFDGSCPDGFEYFEAGAGRFLIGQNETQLQGLSTAQKNALVAQGKAFRDKNGNIITYKTGDTGGEAYHTLTLDELPTHNHKVPDIKASCSGSDCAGYAMAQVGAVGSTVWSNSNEIPTGPSGGNKSHENRPPYYTVNYCIYSGK